jgi:tRNA A37 methylthiotransferase MiaB
MRPGTPAERLPDRVDGTLAGVRAAELRAIAEQKAAAYRASRAGGRADVIAIGGGPRREGLTGDYLTVDLADDTIPRGERFEATLTVHRSSLIAHRA